MITISLLLVCCSDCQLLRWTRQSACSIMGETEDPQLEQQQEQQNPNYCNSSSTATTTSKPSTAYFIPPPGSVSLADKALPVFEQALRGTLRSAAAPYVFTRGTAGAGPFKALLAQLGETVWDEQAHERENVRITRPAHDAWGVRKAVLVYCDDFLKGVYRYGR